MAYKCYNGQLLLPFEQDWKIYERDTDTMTEQTYLDRDKQIQSFIRSGERLQAARREEFEYPDGVVPSDVKVDPTSVLGFDLSDAFLLSQELQDKIASAKARSRKLADEANASPKDEPSSSESTT